MTILIYTLNIHYLSLFFFVFRIDYATTTLTISIIGSINDIYTIYCLSNFNKIVNFHDFKTRGTSFK